MNKYGLIRVAAAIPEVIVGNVRHNVERIKELCEKAYKDKVKILVFPELSLTGYTCGDLFHQQGLIQQLEDEMYDLVCESSKWIGMTVIVGSPVYEEEVLKNAAIIISSGEVIGVVGKKNLPGYKEFYEPRWFTPDTKDPQVFEIGGVKFGVEICEDLWSPEPPSIELVKKGAELIFNLSASNELVGKHEYLVKMLEQHSARLICGYVYSSSGYGESSQDLVYAGNGIILENGKILGKSERFILGSQLIVQDIDVQAIRTERMVNTSFRGFFKPEKSIRINTFNTIDDPDTLRTWNAYPFKASDERCKEILEIQSHALAKRLQHTKMSPVIGVSGGSDSTWALIVIMESLKKLGRPAKDCIGVSMPGFATSNRTRDNAWKLMEAFGVDSHEIDITGICKSELEALNHPMNVQDITFENVQARARTSILMNLANQEGGLVVGTGDLSELALGWCTYNADHMSMYGVNVGVPKTLIKRLIGWYRDLHIVEPIYEILKDILDTPVSPELTGTGADGSGAQVTEDKIGPYELHDFFLYYMLRYGFSPNKLLYIAKRSELGDKYDMNTVKKWLKVFIKRFFSQQFKRSCLPDGPKIGSISLSPRGDWRMPSDASIEGWI